LEAIGLVTRLSVMSNEKYASTFGNPTGSAFAIQKQLDDLQKSWKLEQTDLPRLAQSIHHWHSIMMEFSREAQQASSERNLLSKRLADSEARVERLEGALTKLHRKNAKLKEKLENQQTQKKSLVKKVKEYVKKTKKSTEVANQQLVMEQLDAHERIMRLEASLRRESLSTTNGNRSRTSSRDASCFSELDCISVSPEMDECQSVSSTSTLPSTVTDEGIATVSIVPQSASSSPIVHQQQQPSGDDDDDQVEFIFSPGQRIGLQFVKVPLSSGPKRGLLSEDEPKKIPFSRLLGKRDYALFVCGNHGFDASRTPPPIGSRLLSVNGSHDLDEMLALDGSCLEHLSVRLVFSSQESLSTKQEELVVRAYEKAKKFTTATTNDGLELVCVSPETPASTSTSSSSLPKLPSPSLQVPKLPRFGLKQGESEHAPRRPGKQATEKLGNAMKAMGSQFKSLF